jgi:hypothetical protein
MDDHCRCGLGSHVAGHKADPQLRASRRSAHGDVYVGVVPLHCGVTDYVRHPGIRTRQIVGARLTEVLSISLLDGREVAEVQRRWVGVGRGIERA